MRLRALSWVAAFAAASCSDDPRDAPSGLGKEWVYDLSAYRKVDPRLVAYVEMPAIDPGLAEVRGIAAGAEDRVFASGDRVVRIFGRGGARIGEISIDGEPGCLAVAPSGRLYVGVRAAADGIVQDRVQVFGSAREPVARWEGLGEKGILTSIAATDEDVFVADAGNRLVRRHDPSGKVVLEIGARDAEKDYFGFQIPSPYFDVAVDRDGILWIANPGMLRIEAYAFDGCIGSSWGEASPAIEDFCGCCNPAHFAVAPDGSFITSEKGLARVKVYDRDGGFSCVVAPPTAFAEEGHAMDVAVDSAGRVLVLDPATRKIRMFVREAEGGS
ncbi:MAG: NHL repeat-containing protein [Planctomycetes bacterium]|nr:NHL repeat-containing protein [Planctomycetota bacterium]